MAQEIAKQGPNIYRLSAYPLGSFPLSSFFDQYYRGITNRYEAREAIAQYMLEETKMGSYQYYHCLYSGMWDDYFLK